MFRSHRWLSVAALIFCSRIAAQPPLSTIQDVLYRADGSPFNGVVTITWKTFEASDSSDIASDVKRITITAGNLYVQLVPSTTASPAAAYAVQYSSAGRTTFSETWAVPPSNVPLRVRDIRLAPGAVTTPGPPSSTSVQLNDVIGLQTALNLRPAMGSAFAASRAAVIDALGSLDGAVGNLSDCLHVDGSSGPCGNGGGPAGNAVFIDGEIPAGAVNGSNATFTLTNAPNPPSSLALYRNGLLLQQNVDYTLSTGSITMQSPAVPQTGDTLIASYRMAANLPGVGFVDSETPAGSIDGGNTVFTLSQNPNPDGSLAVFRNGMRLKSGVDYTTTGNSITFAAGTIPQIGDILQCSYRIAQ